MPVAYPERIIDTCIDMYKNGGIRANFGKKVDFLEVDWVYCMTRASAKTAHRADEVRELVYEFAVKYTDYLLGLDEIHTEEKLFVPQEFSTRLRAVLKEKGVSGEKLKRDLSLSGSVLFKWLSGKAQPSAHSLTALAKYFDCSIDYLIGRRK